MIDELIDTKEAAKILNLSDRTLEGLRQRGAGPKFVSISKRCVKYRRSDLTDWIKERLCSSTAETKRRKK